MPTTSGNTDKTSTERNEGIDEVPKYPRWVLELIRRGGPADPIGDAHLPVVSLETADPNVLVAALRAAADRYDVPRPVVLRDDIELGPGTMRAFADMLGGRGPLHRGQPPSLGERPHSAVHCMQAGRPHPGACVEPPGTWSEFAAAVPYDAEPAGPRPDVLGDFLDHGFVGMGDLDVLRARVLDLRADRDRWKRIAGREREVADAWRVAATADQPPHWAKPEANVGPLVEVDGHWVEQIPADGPGNRPEPAQEPRTPPTEGGGKPPGSPEGSQGLSGRPKETGGVWGSYVDYLEHLEAQMAARTAVADRKVSAVWLHRCQEIRDALLRAGVYPVGGTPGVVGAVQDVLREHARLLARLRDRPPAAVEPPRERDYVIQLNREQNGQLLTWLSTNASGGSISLGRRLTVDAVEHGGLLVRARPYRFDDRAAEEAANVADRDRLVEIVRGILERHRYSEEKAACSCTWFGGYPLHVARLVADAYLAVRP